MSDNAIRHLLQPIEEQLAALVQRREELVGSLNTQIEQLEIAIAALKQAEKAARSMSTVKSGDVVHRIDNLLSQMPVHSYAESGVTPAQRVLRYLKSVGAADNAAIVDVLAEYVAPTPTKSQRQIVSNAIYDLRQRGKLTMENGKLVLVQS